MNLYIPFVLILQQKSFALSDLADLVINIDMSNGIRHWIRLVEGLASPQPPTGVLASYTDQDGYTVSIVGMPDDPTGAGRCGKMYISDGKTTVSAGYWMNYPEKAWNIPLRKWRGMSWQDRAAMEAKQQATAYKPLKDQFAVRTHNDYEAIMQDSDNKRMIANKWKNGQNFTPSEAIICKTMLRPEVHRQVDQRTTLPE